MYTLIAPYYEELFPASETSIRFLSSLLRSDRAPSACHALDVACGTGEHARKLAVLGPSVTGIDMDEEMIRLAGARSSDVSLRFLVGDMTRLDSVLPDDGRFDLVYCIGNSLAHLPDEAAVSRFLASTVSVLHPRGSAAVQIINFDRIGDQPVFELPTLVSTDGRIALSRRYEPGSDRDHVEFVTTLMVDGEPHPPESVTLLALTRGRLEALFSAAGLVTVETYGGFEGAPWTPDAFVTVAVGRPS